MSRRGFTILELSLAAALGALVLLAALGVFSSMDRGDRVLAARAKENAGLEVASIAIENAIGTLVMESGGQTGSGSKTGTKAGSRPTPRPRPRATRAGRRPRRDARDFCWRAI